MVSYGKKRFLFTGDIEEEAQEEILSRGENLQADLLKVPHHGGSSAVYPAFFESVKPRITLLGVGRGNKFGFPSKRGLAVCQELGADIRRTDQNGAITITVGLDSILRISNYKL
jgi:competence protein ComEC